MKVGFIGLGRIGEPMALRILGAGHDLVGHARRPDGRDALRQAGARLTASLAEVVQDADVVCVNLFTDAQMREVFFDQGALSAMRPGSVLAIHTTGSPEVVEELAAAAPELSVLDAAFSGTAEMALAGGITLLIGGEAEALERARPVLSTYADALLLLGGVGAGRRAKLLNNLMFAADVSLAAEAITAAEAMGLDPRVFIKAIQRCSGSSRGFGIFDVDAPVQAVLDRVAEYLDKDVDAARAAAAAEGAQLPLLSAAARWGSRQQP